MSAHRLVILTLFSFAVLSLAACAPAAEPPVVEEEEEAPPPPPPPTLYDLTEVDIVQAEPGFTSRNITFDGIKIGDMTNDVLDILGDQVARTGSNPEYYVSAYRGGGLLIYTHKLTGEIRGIEILTRIADGIATPQFREWLETGDLEVVRALMDVSNEQIEENFDTGATEHAYDRRGIRFLTYPEGPNAIRFSYLP